MAKQVTCTINGTDYPVLFTMGAMLRFKRLTGHDVSQMTGDMEDAATLIYCAVQSGAKANNIPFDYDLETFCDNMPMEAFAELSEAVMVQMGVTPGVDVRDRTDVTGKDAATGSASETKKKTKGKK